MLLCQLPCVLVGQPEDILKAIEDSDSFPLSMRALREDRIVPRREYVIEGESHGDR